MPINKLTKRLEKGAPLTPGEADGNLDTIAAFVNALETRANASTNADGSLKAGVVDAGQLKDGAIPAKKIAAAAMGLGLKLVIPDAPAVPYFTLNVDATISIDPDTGVVTIPALKNFGNGGLRLVIADEQVAGTNGGTFTQNLDFTRKLATIRVNEIGNAVAILASGNPNGNGNKITLPAGTYRCWVSAPALQCGNHKAWLYNATTNTDILVGTSEVTGLGANYGTTRSVIVGTFTLNAQSDVEVRHRCTSTLVNAGFGAAAGFKTEVYTVAEFIKIA